MKFALALAATLAAGAINAGEMQQVDVLRDGPRYVVNMKALLVIDQERAWAVLTDYPQLERINPNIRETELLEQFEDGALLRTAVEFCVLWICKTIIQQQRMTILDTGPDYAWLQAVVDPELSDLAYGQGDWILTAAGAEQTELAFRAEIEPDFWVPPLIGPWLIKRALVREGEATVAGLERAANEP